MVSRKKMISVILTGSILVMMFASGCGRQGVDYNMSGNPDGENGDNTDTEGKLAEQLKIPESCDVSINVGNTFIESITIQDDHIEVPATGGMSVVYCELDRKDNSYKKQMAELLFDEGTAIYAWSYENRIKRDIEKDLEYWKLVREESLAEGDSVELEDDYISRYERDLQDAPEEYPLADDYSEKSFIGTRNGVEYWFDVYPYGNDYSMATYASLHMRDQLAYRPFEGMTDGYIVEGPAVDRFDGVNACTITLGEAVGVAEYFLDDCGVTDMIQSEASILGWMYYHQGSDEETIIEYDGYIITFSKMVHYTPAYCGDVLNVDNLQAGDMSIDIPMEKFTVYVDDSGVIKASWTTMFSPTGEEEINVELLSWNEMIEAANQNIPAYYEKYSISHRRLNITFNDVRLSYYPVPDETREKTYKYIPVWVFLQYDDIDSYFLSPYQMVIINAMDGTVVDPVEVAKGLGNY